MYLVFFFLCKQKTAYEMRISDWSSDVCSSDLKTGYSGRIRTLSLDIAVAIVTAEASETENAPDCRVHAESEEGPEIGAGWKRSSDKAGDFVSIQQIGRASGRDRVCQSV